MLSLKANWADLRTLGEKIAFSKESEKGALSLNTKLLHRWNNCIESVLKVMNKIIMLF